jgi:hypothetical protein
MSAVFGGIGTSATYSCPTVASAVLPNSGITTPSARSMRAVAIRSAPDTASAYGSAADVLMMPPYTGYETGEVKSATVASTLPIAAILFSSSSGKYSPPNSVSPPTTAATPSSTAWRPHSAAVFGSLLVSHTMTSSGLPLMPPRELIPSAAP